MYEKIEINCVEKDKNNSFSISKISFWKEDATYYAAFYFDCEQKKDSFLETLRTLIKVRSAENDQEYTLVICPKEKHIENAIIISGDIVGTINLLISQGVLRGADKEVFDSNNLDEQDLQKFLAENQKQIESEAKASLPRCNIF